MSHVFRPPWDYAVRHQERTKRVGARPQGDTPTNVTPTYPDFVPRFNKTKNNTNRRLLVPVLSEYDPPSASTADVVVRPTVKHRSTTNRRTQGTDFVPAMATSATVAAVPPAYFPVKQHTRHSHRKLRTLVEVNWVDKAPGTGAQFGDTTEFTYSGSTNRSLIETPPPIGAWSVAVKTAEPATIFTPRVNRVSFERVLQKLPELDERNVVSGSAATVGAFTPVLRVNRRKPGPLTLEMTEVIRDTLTAPTSPAFLLKPFKEIRRHSPRKHLTVLPLLERPVLPASTWRTVRSLPPVWVREIRSRRLQTLPTPVAELLREKSFGPDLVRPVFVPTRRTERRLLRERPLVVFPETPLPSIEHPAHERAPFRFRKALGRRLQRLPSSIYRDFPTVLDQGEDTYLLSYIDDKDKYLQGDISRSAYLNSDMSEAVYLYAPIDQQESYYLNSDMSDVVYLNAD